MADEELFQIRFALEACLLQCRAFLAGHMLFLSHLFVTGHKGRLSRKAFRKCLKQAPKRFAKRAQAARDYYDQRVFGARKDTAAARWGALTASLRGESADPEQLTLSSAGADSPLDGMLFDWPAGQQTTCERLVQSLEHGMLQLIADLAPQVYELPWEPEPYRAGSRPADQSQ